MLLAVRGLLRSRYPARIPGRKAAGANRCRTEHLQLVQIPHAGLHEKAMAIPEPSSVSGSARTYENAMLILERRRQTSRPPPAPDAESKARSEHHSRTSRGVPSLLGMSEWLDMLGHSESDVNALNVIHIAGTKGKGSTCAFVDSFLRTHGKRTGFPSKVGLYTSPHLIYPEERIRINFKPLPRESLAKYFFEIYDKLPQIASEPDSTKPPVQRGPRYLQLWALLALHTFIREEVDAVVLETHNGGENDATNVIAKPLVTAITTLGLDHVAILGPTIENVAWHKAGIFKREAVALSTTQVPQTIEILQQRARQVGQDVGFVDLDSRLPVTSRNLEPSVQRKNASLAAAAAQAFLQRTGSQDISVDDLRNGVERWSWPGRYQILPRGAQTWFLDAAHCELSVTLAVEWFAQESPALVSSGEIVNRVLVFSHLNKLRDSIALLEKLISALEESNIALHHVIFTTYNETTEDPAGVPENLTTFKQVWQHRFPSTPVWAEATIQRAIGLVHRLSDGVKNTHILVTGSQYLVGPSLHLLQTQGQHDLGPDAKADHILAQ